MHVVYVVHVVHVVHVVYVVHVTHVLKGFPIHSSLLSANLIPESVSFSEALFFSCYWSLLEESSPSSGGRRGY